VYIAYWLLPVMLLVTGVLRCDAVQLIVAGMVVYGSDSMVACADTE